MLLPPIASLFLLALAGALTARLARQALPATLGLERRQRPFRWPWMEVAGAILWLLVALHHGSSPDAWPSYVFFTLLLATTATDIWLQLIPDRLTFPGAALALVLAALWPSRMLLTFGQNELLHLIGLGEAPPWLGGWVLAAWGALLGFAALEALRRVFGMWAGTEVMGMGDAKLLMLIGAFLGPLPTLLALALSFPIGVVLGLIRLWTRGQHHGPFGPALAIAAGLTALRGGTVLNAVGTLEQGLERLPPTALLAVAGGLVLILIVLMLRLRRRAAEHEAAIEEHYRQIDEEMR